MSMAERRGRRGPNGTTTLGEDESLQDIPLETLISSTVDSQSARLSLRGRWELASVLNFLHVFQPIIHCDLEVSAEEIETALISPNNTLAKLHIALLKGIPPVSKSLGESNFWLTALCKKLVEWWPWVAEGDVPLVAYHGEEILRYNELDATTRLLMLKALCEIRLEQDDTWRFIEDALKQGNDLSTFRMDSLGRDNDGTTYWYDGDSKIGHRLYKEVSNVEPRPKAKGRGRFVQPMFNIQWETLATNLDEFLDISDKLSSSRNIMEVDVGKKVKVDIIPVIEELNKKKERALRRQQKQATLLDSFLYSNGTDNARSLRDRKPVKYTFDEYDRSIDEAIEITKKGKTTQESKDEGKHRELLANGKDTLPQGISESYESSALNYIHENGNHPKLEDQASSPDKTHVDDHGYDKDDDDDDEYVGEEDTDIETDEEHDIETDGENEDDCDNKMPANMTDNHGLRRSKRGMAHVTDLGNTSALIMENNKDISIIERENRGAKKRLMSRPVPKMENTIYCVSDAENENPQAVVERVLEKRKGRLDIDLNEEASIAEV
ncbi:hypothetical protein AMTRI_Chr05g73480 [Amborella trichopoda]